MVLSWCVRLMTLALAASSRMGRELLTGGFTGVLTFSPDCAATSYVCPDVLRLPRCQAQGRGRGPERRGLRRRHQVVRQVRQGDGKSLRGCTPSAT